MSFFSQTNDMPLDNFFPGLIDDNDWSSCFCGFSQKIDKIFEFCKIKKKAKGVDLQMKTNFEYEKIEISKKNKSTFLLLLVLFFMLKTTHAYVTFMIEIK
jgi:hypothetical protein